MTRLYGHDDAVAALRDAAMARKLHHAWLLAGPQGIGKATFADQAAQWLLADAAGLADDRGDFTLADDHPTARLIAAGSHPDLRRLERLPKDAGGELARSITVGQVRGLHGLFNTTTSFSERRVVVIDAIDDMERAAANALLKNLEEPPAGTTFLLVSHAPGRLLPTIRSRCRLLRFHPLDQAAMAAVMRQAAPEASEAERDALAGVARGSPGLGLRFAGLDIAALDGAIERLATDGDPSNAMRSALARQLAAKAAQPRYEAFLERAPARIAVAARNAKGVALADTIGLWERARDLAGAAVPLSLDVQTTVIELAGLVAGLARIGSAAKA